ncbi:MAG: hypothetical protein M0C28_31830 [Candidatus Moduliflexus flocculans]|nr:hypothetical protein [Candidatus Moduliflexus flocculans]
MSAVVLRRRGPMHNESRRCGATSWRHDVAPRRADAWERSTRGKDEGRVAIRSERDRRDGRRDSLRRASIR